MTRVKLEGGPLDGGEFDVRPPWPRASVSFEDETGAVHVYHVDDVAGAGIAVYHATLDPTQER